jgi:hypothetical protein
VFAEEKKNEEESVKKEKKKLKMYVGRAMKKEEREREVKK